MENTDKDNNAENETSETKETLTNTTIKYKDFKVEELAIDKLIHFDNHPFKLYKGQLFDDMVKSIRNSGVIHPIIVKPSKKSADKYEILSGHNRVEASKVAELTTVPAIIRQDLTDDEAMLIVTETNLIQRSFEDMSHSERAVVLNTHYNAIKKKQGYRTDMVEEIEKMLKPTDEKKTSAPVGLRLETRKQVGSQHGIGKTTVARYLNIYKLIDGLKERLDNNEIAIRTAVSLSYLNEGEQKIVNELLGDDSSNIDSNKAEAIRKKSSESGLDRGEATKILNAKSISDKVKDKDERKLSKKILNKYFPNMKKQQDIDKILELALAQYFSKLQDKEINE